VYQDAEFRMAKVEDMLAGEIAKGKVALAAAVSASL
jgi:hypothetical protein